MTSTPPTKRPQQTSKSRATHLVAADESRKWLVLLAIGISTFMSALDGSVVNTTLPVVRQSLGSSIAAIEWVVTIYLLVLSGLLLSFGRLGDMRGNKQVFLTGFGIFLAGSMLCGMAPSIPALVAFRGLQALGAAMIQANSPAILTKNFPARQRGQALGIQATMTYLGLTVGPTLGGWLTDVYSWRMVFYINIPVGLIAMLLGMRFIPSDTSKVDAEEFDLLGALLFMSGLVSLLLGLNQGHALGWTSPIILGLLGAAFVLLGLFIFVERRTQHPMLDLRLFGARAFSTAVSSAVLNYICVYSILFLMPFYLIQGRGFSPTQAGMLLTSQPIIMAIIAPISGTLSDRIGTRSPTTLGMALLAGGLVLLSRLGADSAYTQITIALGVAGFGTGMFISPNNSALMGAAPRHRQGVAAGTLATARNMGMSLGVGLAGAIFTSLLSSNHGDTNSNLFYAIQTSFLVATGIALLGALVAGLFASTKKAEYVEQ